MIHIDPLDSLADWKVMRCGIRGDGNLRGAVYALPGYYADDSNLGDLVLADDVTYGREVQDELCALGRKLGRDAGPGVFLLWENSD